MTAGRERRPGWSVPGAANLGSPPASDGTACIVALGAFARLAGRPTPVRPSALGAALVERHEGDFRAAVGELALRLTELEDQR